MTLKNHERNRRTNALHFALREDRCGKEYQRGGYLRGIAEVMAVLLVNTYILALPYLSLLPALFYPVAAQR